MVACDRKKPLRCRSRPIPSTPTRIFQHLSARSTSASGRGIVQSATRFHAVCTTRSYEVVDNFHRRSDAGFAKLSSVVVHTTGASPSMTDAALPVHRHEQTLRRELDREVSTLEGVMTVAEIRREIRKRGLPKPPAEFGTEFGCQRSVKFFLSQWAEVEVSRDGFTWTKELRAGVFPYRSRQKKGRADQGKPATKNDLQSRPPNLLEYPNTLRGTPCSKRLQELSRPQTVGVRIPKFSR